MLKAVGVLSASEPVKGIIVDPRGVEVPENVPVLDSHNVANGCLGHLARAWAEDDVLLWGELVFTGRAGRRVFELIERGSLNGVSCRFQTERMAIYDADGDPLDIEEAIERGPDDPDLIVVATRSVLTEVSITSVPADGACFVRACGLTGMAWAAIADGERALDRILRSDGVVIADNMRPYRRIVMPPSIQFGEPEPIR
jgi:hypothetical protein